MKLFLAEIQKLQAAKTRECSSSGTNHPWSARQTDKQRRHFPDCLQCI